MLWQVYRSQQEELAVTVDEITLSLNAVEPFGLILTIDKADYFTTRQCRQAYFMQTLERQVSMVVGDSFVWQKYRTSCFVAAEAFNRFSNGTYSQLRGQVELLANREVCQFVNRWLAEDTRIKPESGGEGSGFIYSPHRVEQQRGLLDGWQQLKLDSQFHGVIIRNEPLLNNRKNGNSSVA